MTKVREFLAATGCVVLVGCGAATQPEARSQVAGVRCASLGGAEREAASLLAASNVQRVEPTYREIQHISERLPLYVSGARIYVPAERGMSEAYLERALSCHAAGAHEAAPNDPLRAEGVQWIDVQAAGQSFAIAVTGVDREAGEEIWRRAQALGASGTQVEVEQLSQRPRATF